MGKAFSGGEALERKLKEIADRVGQNTTLRVGFLEGSQYPDGTSVPMVAAIQNYGAPAAGIPARPFFTTMVREKSPGWGDAIARIAKKQNFDMQKTMQLMGEGITDQLQESIVKFSGTSLADETAARKGFSKQLIDTATMVNSVAYEVGSERFEAETKYQGVTGKSGKFRLVRQKKGKA